MFCFFVFGFALFFCWPPLASAASVESAGCSAKIRIEKLEIVENKMMRPTRPNVALIRVLKTDCGYLASGSIYRSTNISTQNVLSDMVTEGVEWPTSVRSETFSIMGKTEKMLYFRYVNQRVDGAGGDKFVEFGVGLR